MALRRAWVGLGVQRDHLHQLSQLRAGGATDWSAGGMDAEFIKAQGGWTSPTYLQYIRDNVMHCFNRAAAMVTAMRDLLMSWSVVW